MGAGIPDALQVLVDRIAGAGLAASHTIGGVSVPSAWVHAHSYERLTIGGGGRIGVYIDLIAEDLAENLVIDQLDAMLGKALTVVTPSGPVETDVVVEFGSAALPAFRIPITIEYTQE